MVFFLFYFFIKSYCCEYVDPKMLFNAFNDRLYFIFDTKKNNASFKIGADVVFENLHQNILRQKNIFAQAGDFTSMHCLF